jgi:hypothetical protein
MLVIGAYKGLRVASSTFVQESALRLQAKELLPYRSDDCPCKSGTRYHIIRVFRSKEVNVVSIAIELSPRGDDEVNGNRIQDTVEETTQKSSL